MHRMRKSYGESLTSPGTPEDEKGWWSERVGRERRRTISATALLPYSTGRTLPSKWDDAERWISSPFSGFKTPPIKTRPTGLVYLQGPTAAGQKKFSPLTTGVLAPQGLSIHYEPHTTCPAPDDKRDGGKEQESFLPYRDAATQISPEGSIHSSPPGRLSFSACLYGSSVEVRDVEVDKGSSTGSPLKKQQVESSTKPPAWSTAEAPPKLEKEESKIIAWENLQKAKAEDAIQKLEMKLEKKRRKAMEKIRTKLRGSQMKAEAMRSSLWDQNRRISHDKTSWCRFMKCLCLSW